MGQRYEVQAIDKSAIVGNSILPIHGFALVLASQNGFQNDVAKEGLGNYFAQVPFHT
jgi:hypothetical protein